MKSKFFVKKMVFFKKNSIYFSNCICIFVSQAVLIIKQSASKFIQVLVYKITVIYTKLKKSGVFEKIYFFSCLTVGLVVASVYVRYSETSSLNTPPAPTAYCVEYKNPVFEKRMAFFENRSPAPSATITQLSPTVENTALVGETAGNTAVVGETAGNTAVVGDSPALKMQERFEKSPFASTLTSQRKKPATAGVSRPAPQNSATARSTTFVSQSTQTSVGKKSFFRRGGKAICVNSANSSPSCGPVTQATENTQSSTTGTQSKTYYSAFSRYILNSILTVYEALYYIPSIPAEIHNPVLEGKSLTANVNEVCPTLSRSSSVSTLTSTSSSFAGPIAEGTEIKMSTDQAQIPSSERAHPGSSSSPGAYPTVATGSGTSISQVDSLLAAHQPTSTAQSLTKAEFKQTTTAQVGTQAGPSSLVEITDAPAEGSARKTASNQNQSVPPSKNVGQISSQEQEIPTAQVGSEAADVSQSKTSVSTSEITALSEAKQNFQSTGTEITQKSCSSSDFEVRPTLPTQSVPRPETSLKAQANVAPQAISDKKISKAHKRGNCFGDKKAKTFETGRTEDKPVMKKVSSEKKVGKLHKRVGCFGNKNSNRFSQTQESLPKKRTFIQWFKGEKPDAVGEGKTRPVGISSAGEFSTPPLPKRRASAPGKSLAQQNQQAAVQQDHRRGSSTQGAVQPSASRSPFSSVSGGFAQPAQNLTPGKSLFASQPNYAPLSEEEMVKLAGVAQSLIAYVQEKSIFRTLGRMALVHMLKTALAAFETDAKVPSKTSTALGEKINQTIDSKKTNMNLQQTIYTSKEARDALKHVCEDWRGEVFLHYTKSGQQKTLNFFRAEFCAERCELLNSSFNFVSLELFNCSSSTGSHGFLGKHFFATNKPVFLKMKSLSYSSASNSGENPNLSNTKELDPFTFENLGYSNYGPMSAPEKEKTESESTYLFFVEENYSKNPKGGIDISVIISRVDLEVVRYMDSICEQEWMDTVLQMDTMKMLEFAAHQEKNYRSSNVVQEAQTAVTDTAKKLMAKKVVSSNPEITAELEKTKIFSRELAQEMRDLLDRFVAFGALDNEIPEHPESD